MKNNDMFLLVVKNNIIIEKCLTQVNHSGILIKSPKHDDEFFEN